MLQALEPPQDLHDLHPEEFVGLEVGEDLDHPLFAAFVDCPMTSARTFDGDVKTRNKSARAPAGSR